MGPAKPSEFHKKKDFGIVNKIVCNFSITPKKISRKHYLKNTKYSSSKSVEYLSNSCLIAIFDMKNFLTLDL